MQKLVLFVLFLFGFLESIRPSFGQQIVDEGTTKRLEKFQTMVIGLGSGDRIQCLQPKKQMVL